MFPIICIFGLLFFACLLVKRKTVLIFIYIFFIIIGIFIVLDSLTLLQASRCHSDGVAWYCKPRLIF